MSRISPPKAELIRFESHDVIATSGYGIRLSGLNDTDHDNGSVTFNGTSYKDPTELINALKSYYPFDIRTVRATGDYTDIANNTVYNALSKDGNSSIVITKYDAIPDGYYTFDKIGGTGLAKDQIIYFKYSGQ